MSACRAKTGRFEMKSVIYARYSSDKQSAESIDDQCRTCRAFAEREGWTNIEVYADRAISGTRKDRPDYQRMLTDAEAKTFDVLLVDDLSRLSRDDVEQGSTLQDLRFWDIRVIGVSDGYDSTSKSHKVISGVRGIINNVYLDDLRDKTHRGLKGKALNGQNTGGRAYGYRHIPIEHPTEKDAFGRPKITGVTRKVDPEQAEIVRQIFRWFAEGRGYREIAGRLNAQQIPSPRGGTWAASSIRPMLRNEVYVGRAVWNRRQWVRNPKTGKRVPKTRPQDEWVTVDAPKLRIVDDKLWRSVQARRDELLATHRERQKDGKQRPGKAPTYLFSSIVKCGTCGGDYIKANKTHYRCSTYLNKGKVACDNSVSVRKDVLEERLLHTIKTELFDDDSFETFKAEARRVLDQRMKDRKKDTAKQQRELTKVEREIANMVGFVKAGNITPTLSDELRKAEAEKERLAAELSADVPAIDDVEEIFADVLDRYGAMAFNLETFAARDVTKARNMIKALVGGHITLRPTGRGGLKAELRGDYGGLIQLVAEHPGTRAGASKVRMVAGAGFEPATFRL